jgi:hypothetical protein
MLTRELALSLADPAQNNLFLVTVPFTNGKHFHVVAETISMTFPKVPFRPRFSQGSNTYYPETSDIDGISISFYETHTYQVTGWLDTWRKLLIDSRGNYGLPAVYKKDVPVQVFSRENLSEPTLTFIYQGIAPSDQSPFDMSYEDEAGRLIVEAQFSCDSMIFEGWGE